MVECEEKATPTPTENKYSGDDLSVLLKHYYKRLFPTKLYHKWLQYGDGTNTFENREFSFTLKDDIYIRYMSFGDAAELDKELQKKVPYKIDIGAVYNHKPKDNKTLQAGVFKPLEKELVFDIDMTDYDDVRTCCSGAAICKKCWPFMNLALKIIDQALSEDFGFKHRLWVYSGRRGVHCWVADESARKLTQAGRSAVAEYINVIKGGESQNKKVQFKGFHLHPALDRAKTYVEKYFTEQYLSEQNILGTKEQRDLMLKLIPDDATRSSIEKSWATLGDASSNKLWSKLVFHVEQKHNKFVLEEIMFQYVYPRLDINVSKGLNHLLKSPFCIHPKTGRVCVPINPATIDNFNPETVPTISLLMQELDDIKDANGDTASQDPKETKDYMSTSLRESIQLFKKFINNLEMQHRASVKKEPTTDF